MYECTKQVCAALARCARELAEIELALERVGLVKLEREIQEIRDAIMLQEDLLVEASDRWINDSARQAQEASATVMKAALAGAELAKRTEPGPCNEAEGTS